MPVKMELAIREGWKATENDRFAEALEVRFIDEKTGKVMFRYAPKCEDIVFWEQTFKDLTKYDQKVLELKAIIREIDGRGVRLAGTGYKTEEPLKT